MEVDQRQTLVKKKKNFYDSQKPQTNKSKNKLSDKTKLESDYLYFFPLQYPGNKC